MRKIHFKRRLYRRGRKYRNKMIVMSLVGLVFLLSCGYAAFQTNLTLNVSGNIKDLQTEVDSNVPTDELLFWGQANNSENTLTTLKDKSGNNNDGTLYNFDNTSTSGYSDDELVFDGVDDYVNIGLAGYDFENSFSLVAYVKIISYDSYDNIFCNQQYAGFALEIVKGFALEGYNEEYKLATSSSTAEINKYYTVIGIYDGTNLKLYVDGNLEASTISDTVTISPEPILLGGNPKDGVGNMEFANMSLKEAMVYDRALTEDEVKTITDGFEKKYL